MCIRDRVQVGRDSFVYRIGADDTVERVDVVTGARRAGVVEIKQGLAAGQRIVVDGTGKLRPGLKVAARDAAPASGAKPADAPAPVATEEHGG